MPTTFSTPFKNAVLNSIIGSAATSNTTSMAYYINCYSGTQTASPTDTPTGSFVNTTGTQAPNVNTFMSAPSGGISQLSSSRAGTVNANNAITVTTARIYASNGTTPIIDTTASLLGGGGGVIVPTMTSSTGVPFVVDFFSLRMPATNGTLSINDSLRDAIVSAICVASANIGACSVATINVYSGSIPSSANAAATGTILWTGTTAATGASWGTVSGGSASLASNITANASATGTATYARIIKNTFVIQGTVGTSGSGADFIMSDTAMTSGLSYSLTTATITLPG